MKDASEFSFANKYINESNNEQIRTIRSQLFSFSMCQYSEEQLQNKIMWDLYTKDKEGCCIILEFEKSNIDRWCDFSLGLINYHPYSNEIKKLIDFKHAHSEFFKEKI